MERLIGRARWHRHPNAVQGSPQMRNWLADPGSMTFKLRARCEELSVLRLRQRTGNALIDECRLLELTPREPVEERDVILSCDGEPMVFGHTVTPLGSASAWPFFHRLGARPLGASLFTDPLVRRAPLQFARLHAGHSLVRRIGRVLDLHAALPLYARRSLFYRRGNFLLVTDVFLPALGKLMALNNDAF